MRCHWLIIGTKRLGSALHQLHWCCPMRSQAYLLPLNIGCIGPNNSFVCRRDWLLLTPHKHPLQLHILHSLPSCASHADLVAHLEMLSWKELSHSCCLQAIYVALSTSIHAEWALVAIVVMGRMFVSARRGSTAARKPTGRPHARPLLIRVSSLVHTSGAARNRFSWKTSIIAHPPTISLLCLCRDIICDLRWLNPHACTGNTSRDWNCRFSLQWYFTALMHEMPSITPQERIFL